MVTFNEVGFNLSIASKILLSFILSPFKSATTVLSLISKPAFSNFSQLGYVISRFMGDLSSFNSINFNDIVFPPIFYFLDFLTPYFFQICFFSYDWEQAFVKKY